MAWQVESQADRQRDLAQQLAAAGRQHAAAQQAPRSGVGDQLHAAGRLPGDDRPRQIAHGHRLGAHGVTGGARLLLR